MRLNTNRWGWNVHEATIKLCKKCFRINEMQIEGIEDAIWSKDGIRQKLPFSKEKHFNLCQLLLWHITFEIMATFRLIGWTNAYQKQSNQIFPPSFPLRTGILEGVACSDFFICFLRVALQQLILGVHKIQRPINKSFQKNVQHWLKL